MLFHTVEYTSVFTIMVADEKKKQKKTDRIETLLRDKYRLSN